MLVIGLTGGIGSGKSTVAALFSRLNITVIDADQIAKALTTSSQPAFERIVDHFGQAVLSNKNRLNRKKLREIIFNSPKQRKWLEKLLHPLIIKKIEERAKKAKSPYCIVMAPLLLEIKRFLSIDRVLVVDTTLDLQIKRVKQRDRMRESDIQAIISTQLSRAERLAHADDVILNLKAKAVLQKKVKTLHTFYLKMAKNH